MTDDQDYRLIDAEDEAVNTGNTAKRIALGTAAAAGVAGVAVAGEAIYSHFDNNDNPSEVPIAGGGNAGEITEDILDPTPDPVVINYNNTIINQPVSKHEDTVGHDTSHTIYEPEVEFTNTTVQIDSETGEYLGGYDEGTIDGKDFAIIDHDGDGIADVMLYDENGNKVFEENEIYELDQNDPIMIGNSNNVHEEYIDLGHPDGVEIPHDAANIKESTFYFNEEGEYLGSVDEGVIGSKAVMYADVDGDLLADMAAYDRNGNGVIEEDEVELLDEDNIIVMGRGEIARSKIVHPEDEYIDDYNEPEIHYAGIDPKDAPETLAAGDEYHEEPQPGDPLTASVAPEDPADIEDETLAYDGMTAESSVDESFTNDIIPDDTIAMA